MTRGADITDHELIAACSTARVNAAVEAGQRVYTAVFTVAARPGRILYLSPRTFAVGHAEAAAVYAREYAARILTPQWGEGIRVLSVRWDRGA